MSPVVLPSPEELTRLTWWQRDKAIRAARALLRSYGALVEAADMPARRTRLAPEVLAERKRAEGEAIREEARRLERLAHQGAS